MVIWDLSSILLCFSSYCNSFFSFKTFISLNFYSTMTFSVYLYVDFMILFLSWKLWMNLWSSLMSLVICFRIFSIFSRSGFSLILLDVLLLFFESGLLGLEILGQFMKVKLRSLGLGGEHRFIVLELLFLGPDLVFLVGNYIQKLSFFLYRIMPIRYIRSLPPTTESTDTPW